MNRKKAERKPLPPFDNEGEEQQFWAVHEVVDFFDWEKAEEGSFPALKPSTTTISLRLPEAMLEELKVLATEQDIPYQSLIKMYLAERIAREREQRYRSRGSYLIRDS